MKSVLLSFLLLFFPLAVHAKLAPSEWDELENESELIVFAVAKEIKFSDQNDGSARLRILDTLKGLHEEHFVNVVWTSEFHDQKIYEAQARFILFLKKDENGNFVGTSYGRSFWKMFYNFKDEQKSYVNLNGPLGFISNTPKTITQFIHKEECGVKSKYETRRIYFGDLKDYLNGRH